MKLKKTLFTVLFFSLSIYISGCASHLGPQGIRAEMADMKVHIEAAKKDSAAALQATNAMQNDLSNMKLATDSASTDANETRRLLEQMNARLDKVFGSQSLK